jgi:iron(III) transport system permease protein
MMLENSTRTNVIKPIGSRPYFHMVALDGRKLFIASIGIILVIFVLPPLIFLLVGSVTITNANSTKNYGFGAYISIFTEHGFLESIENSFVFAIGGSLLAVFSGGIVAWLVERTNAPFKALANITTVTSLATPYILYVGAWLMLLGRAGPINAYYRQFTGSFAPLVNVYSLPAMIFIEGMLWSPMVFLLVGATLRNFNPELEEAARMSGASGWQIFRRVTLKLSMPSVLAVMMLVFIRALEAFEVPALVGMPGHVNMLTTDIYETLQMVPPDLGSASALSTVLLGLVAILLYCYGRLTRSAEQFATVTGKNFRPARFDLGKWRTLAGAVVLLNFFLLLVLPLLALIWASILPFYQPLTVRALSLVTLENYRDVLGASRYLGLTANTLIIASATATVVMLLAAVTAWLRVRGGRGAAFLDPLATMPLVFPGIILGVAVMQLFLKIPVGIYGTIWIIVWAFVINSLPYGVRYSYVGMIQLHRELEEAAVMAGATPFANFRRIVLPLLAPSLFAGWIFVFLLSTRVLALPVLLASPSSQTMAVTMFDLLSNGQEPELAALGLLWSLSVTVIVVLFRFVFRHRAIGIQGHG